MYLKKKPKNKTKKTVVKKKRPTKKNPYIVSKLEIDVTQLLLHSRQLFLHGVINEQSAEKVIKGMLALSEISDDPIIMWINSGGGNVLDGFAIIDIMKGLKCPVYTFISGKACSMGGLISIAGKQRIMTSNSIWMAHEMTVAGIDYISKYLARADFQKSLNKRLIRYLEDHTKLTRTEINKALREELWLSPEECKEKGIIDAIART
jgi:ATP-dependent Clp protease protease subunit